MQNNRSKIIIKINIMKTPKILSIKHKIGKSIDNNFSEKIPFCVIYEFEGVITKSTFNVVDQYNDCKPYYVSEEITNRQYNNNCYLVDRYANPERDFISDLKDEWKDFNSGGKNIFSEPRSEELYRVILKYIEKECVRIEEEYVYI